MADVVSCEKRSSMMANIKSKNTKPEILIRKALHALGFRYKINDKSLVGKPDMVLPKYKAIVFINGCFWHKHDCHLFKLPETRKQFWQEKIINNVKRDFENLKLLQSQGWRVLIVWECSIKGRTRIPFDTVINSIGNRIKSDSIFSVIEGSKNGINGFD